MCKCEHLLQCGGFSHLNEQLIYWTGRTAATYRTEGPDTTAAEGRAVFSSFIFKLLMPVIKAPGRGGSRVSAKHRINVFFLFYVFIYFTLAERR